MSRKVFLKEMSTFKIMSALEHGKTLHIQLGSSAMSNEMDNAMLDKFNTFGTEQLVEVKEKFPDFYENSNIIELTEEQ